MARWHSFDWNMATGKVREPTLLEYFATTALSTLAQTLMREAIQNSLDAAVRIDGKPLRPVKVRIFASGSEGALNPERARRWFADLFPHIEAQKKGPRNPPEEDAPCSFLTFEDFNTRGLHGTYERNYTNDGEDNAWIYFFHKEGDTSKQESDRGRWGVGKVVFPGASRIHAFLAYTVREDKQRLMMGQAMLRSREVGNKRYLPDAWYCGPVSPDLPPMPVKEAEILAELRKDFKLKRQGETGLSVIVPYLEEGNGEDDPGINFETVTDAVIADYFLPILKGDLVVQLDSPTKSLEIDRGSIQRLASERRTGLVEQRRQEIELAIWSTGPECRPVEIGCHDADGAVCWTDSLVPDDLRERLKKEFDAGERIAIRIPVQIRRKKDATRDRSFFDVYLQRTGQPRDGRPLFIREGLIIPDVRGRSAPGVRSIVVAEHGGIATLLGDSENPAHTEWQSKSSNFKEKYLYGPSYLRFVCDSVANVVRRIANAPDEEDPSVLLDIFSLPTDGDSGNRGKGRSKKDGGKDEPPPNETPPPPKPKPFSLHRIEDGFKITPVDTSAPHPKVLIVTAAYDVRRGNPFQKWVVADFTFKSLNCVARNARFERLEGNKAVVLVDGPDFEIAIHGFDTWRDLKVNVKLGEKSDETDV